MITKTLTIENADLKILLNADKNIALLLICLLYSLLKLKRGKIHNSKMKLLRKLKLKNFLCNKVREKLKQLIEVLRISKVLT